MTLIRIKKNPNRRVRNPDTGEQLQDDEKYEVVDSPYWRRRIQSADVFEVHCVPEKESDSEKYTHDADASPAGDGSEDVQQSSTDQAKNSEENAGSTESDGDQDQKENASSASNKPEPVKKPKKTASKSNGKK